MSDVIAAIKSDSVSRCVFSIFYLVQEQSCQISSHLKRRSFRLFQEVALTGIRRATATGSKKNNNNNYKQIIPVIGGCCSVWLVERQLSELPCDTGCRHYTPPLSHLQVHCSHVPVNSPQLRSLCLCPSMSVCL